MAPKKELKTTYWYGLFVPIVISVLIIASLLVLVTVNVGEPHDLLKKIRFAGPPKLGVNAAKPPGLLY
uniref:Uncharacterized protein n=1 Tax=viral metagenome TaxID=1070528 RepID=A0A6C0DS12_9ZZZZ